MFAWKTLNSLTRSCGSGKTNLPAALRLCRVGLPLPFPTFPAARWVRWSVLVPSKALILKVTIIVQFCQSVCALWVVFFNHTMWRCQSLMFIKDWSTDFHACYLWFFLYCLTGSAVYLCFRTCNQPRARGTVVLLSTLPLRRLSLFGITPKSGQILTSYGYWFSQILFHRWSSCEIHKSPTIRPPLPFLAWNSVSFCIADST